ncbi:MAG: hypothetical protein HJJLKODD_01177 [Phycisphaerae bacterium]|nr:hypothetical protein [Phycisphaerae bacterium]
MSRYAFTLALLIITAGCNKEEPTVASTEPMTTTYSEPSGTDSSVLQVGGSYAGDENGGTATGSVSAYPSISSTTPSNNSAQGGHSHMVQKGDTLYSLARFYYNDQSQWKKIYEANKSTLHDPNQIKTGTQLFIPE